MVCAVRWPQSPLGMALHLQGFTVLLGTLLILLLLSAAVPAADTLEPQQLTQVFSEDQAASVHMYAGGSGTI